MKISALIVKLLSRTLSIILYNDPKIRPYVRKMFLKNLIPGKYFSVVDN